MATSGLHLNICIDFLLQRYQPDWFPFQPRTPLLNRLDNIEDADMVLNQMDQFVRFIDRELLPHIEKKFDISEVKLGCNYHPNGLEDENYAFRVTYDANMSVDDAKYITTNKDKIINSIDLWFLEIDPSKYIPLKEAISSLSPGQKL